AVQHELSTSTISHSPASLLTANPTSARRARPYKTPWRSGSETRGTERIRHSLCSVSLCRTRNLRDAVLSQNLSQLKRVRSARRRGRKWSHRRLLLRPG